MKKETWKFIIQTIIAILTAILTSLGVTSCMGDWGLLSNDYSACSATNIAPCC